MPDSFSYSELEEKIKDLEDQIAILIDKCCFLEKVLHEVPANIYVSDLAEGVIWCNKTNEETLGYTLDEIREMGGMQYMREILHPDDYVIPDASITHYQNFSGPEYGGLFRARHRSNGTYKWYIGWAKALDKNEEGQVENIVCVDVDMSQSMNTDKQLIEALKENLRLRNKLLVSNLRKREVEVLNLICQGHNTKLISEKLHISKHTVTTHRKNIQRKLGTSNVAELVAFAREAGLG